jgi:DNA-directed RNA polymerase specialized sigma24 family protein
VEAARSGDAAAVERLLVVCQPDLRRFARRACSNGEDGAD